MSSSKPAIVSRRLALLLTLLGLCAGIPARAEMVIVAGARSGITELSREHAEKLYLGRTTTLSDGTPVTLMDLPVGPTRDDFYLKLAGKNSTQIRAYWSRLVFTGRAMPPREADSIAEARQWLADIPNLIGYLDKGDVTPGMRVLLRIP